MGADSHRHASITGDEKIQAVVTTQRSQLPCEVWAIWVIVVAQDDTCTAWKRGHCGKRIRQADLIGHQEDRREALPHRMPRIEAGGEFC